MTNKIEIQRGRGNFKIDWNPNRVLKNQNWSFVHSFWWNWLIFGMVTNSYFDCEQKRRLRYYVHHNQLCRYGIMAKLTAATDGHIRQKIKKKPLCQKTANSIKTAPALVNFSLSIRLFICLKMSLNVFGLVNSRSKLWFSTWVLYKITHLKSMLVAYKNNITGLSYIQICNT